MEAVAIVDNYTGSLKDIAVIRWLKECPEEGELLFTMREGMHTFNVNKSQANLLLRALNKQLTYSHQCEVSDVIKYEIQQILDWANELTYSMEKK